jgi:hypothetical protein
MKKLLALALACIAISIPALAQSPAVAVPSQFATAHTLFIGYGGAGGLTNIESTATLYTSAYHGLSSGPYRLTTTPADADLSAVFSGEGAPGSAGVTFIRLAVFDTKTHALLWIIDERVNGGFKKDSFQKNIDESVAKIVAALNSLAAGKLP